MSYPYQPYLYPYQSAPQPQQIQQPQIQQPVQQIMQQPIQQPQQSIQQMPLQNGGFISIPSEQDARRYPLAPGTFMTFKDERLPYMYEKSRSFSQLDEPTFDKYRLVKEEDEDIEVIDNPQPVYALKEDLSMLKDELASLQEEISLIRKQMRDDKKPTVKKKEADNE